MIFEDKKHNDPKYVGQKPVRVAQVPDEIRDATNIQNDIARTTFSHSVRNLPNKE